jgi:alpha-D-xyloside xylohydrolase
MKALSLAASLAFASSFQVHAAPTGLDPAGHLQSVVPVAKSGFTYARLENGVQFRANGITKNVLFYGPTTVRVNANLGENHWKHPSIVVVSQPEELAFQVDDSDDALILTSQDLKITADKRTGALAFYDTVSGKLFTKERADHPERIKEIEISEAPTYEVENAFTLKPEEGIYGFGFVGQEETNRRGKFLRLIQTNVGIVIPLMISSERYGIMWDTYSIMTFKDDASGATLWAESAPGGVDYYFMAGDNLDEVIADYRHLTGDAPMYPRQAFGLFMSKERYPTQKRIVDVARTFREKGFPLDYIVQDWQYWGSDKDGTWSGMIWNKERYPDPKGMIKAIHDLNLKLMISIWPSVGDETPLAHELDEYGLRFMKPVHWISGKARVYDAFSEKAREIYFKHLKKGLLDKGVDALWMDGTEVEFTTACWNADEVARDIKAAGPNAMGDFSRYLNPYTLMTTKGTYEGQRATSDQRVFTLTRSAWTGAQRYAAASWSGDIFASWKTLQEQISGGVNVTMAGNPYWTQDTGGFFVNDFPGGQDDPVYQELFTRWFQYAAFNPIMRIHGTSIEREPYIFADKNPEMYDALLDAVHLRYRLLPYIYSLSWKVTSEAYTLMRGLVMDFPDDAETRGIDDEFMFGPSFLVHPVTRAMYNVGLPPAQTIPGAYLRTPEGQPGLAVQYFEGMNFETPAGDAVDATVDHRWPGPPLADPPPGLDGFEYFSARWEGTITAPEDGEYEIGFEVDDGARLWLDGKLVAQEWSQSASRYRSAKVTLQEDQRVAVKLEYFQGGLERVLRLAWRTPGQFRALASNEAALDNSMTTYLPRGADWYDFWTNERFTGGRTVEKNCPLNVLPLYVRAGTIVPMGPAVQYATEKPDAPYEIRIYPGADAKFTIYEDDNETYAYERGQRATYDLAWNDATRTLSIGTRNGSFPGMVADRTLNIVLAADARNAGFTETLLDAKSVTYAGQPLDVTFSPRTR